MVRLKCWLFEETLARVFRACKKNFLFYWRNRCYTGRSCSKADQCLTRVSFSFVKKTFLWIIFSFFLRASNHQLVGKIKPSREFDCRPGHENFLCPGRALEVVGTRKNGRARRRHTPTTSKRLLRRLGEQGFFSSCVC